MRRSKGTSTKIRMSPDTLFVHSVSLGSIERVEYRYTHKHIMLKMMMIWKWKRLAMPRAMQSSMHNTPSLKTMLAPSQKALSIAGDSLGGARFFLLHAFVAAACVSRNVGMKEESQAMRRGDPSIE